MPYQLIRRGNQVCIALEGEDTPIDGGCHPTEEEAMRHMAALMANVPEAKAGATISRANMQRLQAMHDHIVAMGAICDIGVDTSPIGSETKGDDLPAAAEAEPIYASVKALGDRTLELRVAWGMDGHHEQFTPETDFDLENFPTPPVAYYHGYTPQGAPAPRPVYIGKTIKRENRADGHYLTAKLNAKPEADRVWQAALGGSAVVSPGTAGHLRRKATDGTLTYWPIVEISAWEYADSRKPAHPHSIAFPVLKALYDEADIALPAAIDDPEAPPQTPGEGVSADAELTSDALERIVATQVASYLLAQNARNR